MAELFGIPWPVLLSFVNLILSSAIVITAFSLLGYMLTRNLRSAVAQAFSVLLACVLVVFAGDVVIPQVARPQASVIWLRGAVDRDCCGAGSLSSFFRCRVAFDAALLSPPAPGRYHKLSHQHRAAVPGPLHRRAGVRWHYHAADQPPVGRPIVSGLCDLLCGHGHLRRLEHHPGAAALPDRRTPAHDLSDHLFCGARAGCLSLPDHRGADVRRRRSSQPHHRVVDGDGGQRRGGHHAGADGLQRGVLWRALA